MCEKCHLAGRKEGARNKYIKGEGGSWGHTKRIETILEGYLLEKSFKRPFCSTVSILLVFFTYLCYITFWALEYHFIENLKLMLKEKFI